MEKDGLVTGEAIHQAAGPSKRVFSITESGKRWIDERLLEEPDLPDFKHRFLIKLSFGSRLPEEDLLTQLDIYEKKLKDKLAALESEKKNVFMAFSRSEKESVLWEMTFENGMMYYQNELEWVGKVKKRLAENRY
jgi:DNA-binding PadR family transcriptional regulator